MDQGPIGMEKHFRTSSTPHRLLTMHHRRRNSSPKSSPNALEAVLAPAIWVDLPAPWQRTGDPHRDQILILGKSLAMVINYPLLLTYLGRFPSPELFQPWKPGSHVLE